MTDSHQTSENHPNPLQQQPLPVPDLPPRLLIDLQGGYCNLKCPKCFVHGYGEREALKGLRGHMSLEDARKILDEVISVKPLIQPNLWTEPLMAKNLKEHIRNFKDRGMPVALNTNGLLLTDDLAQFFVDVQLDSIFISIDATTSETLVKTRGTDKLQQICDAVFRMIGVRADHPFPRIGVSFTTEEANKNELASFIDYWIQHVDVIRVGERFNMRSESRSPLGASSFIPKKRVPCGALYQTMPIHFNGNASVCCLDGYQEAIMGNVFKDGIRSVWHGPELTKIRYYHETGQYDKVPFCRDCNVWGSYVYQEEVLHEKNILIRRSPLLTYYNRFDRLENYKGGRGF